nr:hypothetical protein [Streptomyces sp. NBC_01431]
MVLLGAALLTIAIGDHADAVVIAVAVAVNTTVGVAQEVRADRAVAELSALSAPHARVLRDGVARDVATALVVPGDTLLLGEGDIVAADADLTEASALLTDESMLRRPAVAERALPLPARRPVGGGPRPAGPPADHGEPLPARVRGRFCAPGSGRALRPGPAVTAPHRARGLAWPVPRRGRRSRGVRRGPPPAERFPRKPGGRPP